MFLFQEAEIQKVVTLNQAAILRVEDAFSKLAAGDAVMPPIMRVDIEENNGEVDVKTAYIRAYDKFAIKISSGFFNNPSLGLPSGNGMMLLISTETGIPQAVLLDNGYLTDVRTAAAGAVSARYLAPKKVDTVGIIGAGTQAGYQLLALDQVRDFDHVLIYSRTRERTQQLIDRVEGKISADIRPAENPEEVVRQSQVVVTATPSRDPIIRREWLHPGLHITAMGSDAEHKQELDPKLLPEVDVLACDHKEQCFRLGELHHGLASGVLSKDHDIVELGQLTSGSRPGRTDDRQITVCDLTGTGVQDTAIALFAYHELASAGMGMKVGETSR
ncbi:MAG: cyclodeaminase [Bacillaceae bacterium]|nr:cyclodeaminase [Bacillaceae bacterium]